jgi:ATP-dependent protease ClpP protease subunit
MKALLENRSDLHYEFSDSAFRLLKDENASIETKELVTTLIPRLIDLVPDRCFDSIQPFDKGILFFHGSMSEEGVVDFQHDLLRVHLNLEAGIPITLNLSSFGGSVYSGLALVSSIYDLQRQGRHVNVHVQGMAMSMASVLAQVANHRTMESGAQFMLHKISYGMSGSSDDHEAQMEVTRKLHRSLFSIYASRTGKSVEYYEKVLTKRDWYMNAEEALEEGLVDEIISPPLYLVKQEVTKPKAGSVKKVPFKKTTKRKVSR